MQADIIEFVLANSNLVIPAAITHLAIDDPDDLKVVSWPGEVDLAPDAMYEAIRRDGEWLLT